MKLFLSMAPNHTKWFGDITKLYGLFSYHYCNKDTANLLELYPFKEFILDSGIFTYLNGLDSLNVDWDEYVFNYAKFVRQNQIKNYVEVDVDKIVGYPEVKRLRESLEKQVGWKTMPVWHINRGYDDWLQSVRDYDYVCFGAFITDNLPENKYTSIIRFIQDAKKQDCKVHGLGITAHKWLKILKFDSIDSSSWSAGQRYGHIDFFDKGEIKTRHKQAGEKMIETKQVISHNVNEWIKYAHYLDNNF